MGVKTVINLTSDDAQKDEKGLTEAAGMKYVQIPMTTHQIPSPAQVAEFLAVVNDKAFGADFLHAEFKDFVLGYPAQAAYVAAAALSPKAGG